MSKSITGKSGRHVLENEDLRVRLAEAEETLHAIRNGEVDAIVVAGTCGDQVYSLSSAETPYRVIIEEMNEGAVKLSADGIILYSNRRFAELVREPIERIIGSPFKRFVARADLRRYNALLRQAFHTRTDGVILSSIGTEADPLFLQLSLSPLPPGMLGAVCIMTTDISDLKKNEHALLEMHGSLERRVEERTAELACTVEELRASRIALQKMMEEALEAKNNLEISNKKLIREIAERSRAEEALKESEERFRTMANAIPQLAWMAKPDGFIYWYNKRWYEYTGTTPEAMEGWGWEEVHDPAMLPSVRMRWKDSITTGAPFDMEFPLKGADGIYRPFLTRVMAVKNAQGEVLQWLGTNTDVSEHKKMETELRRLYEQTKQDAVAKTDLLNEVNHRVKNNLMMILGLILADKRRTVAEGRVDLNLAWEKIELRIRGLLKVHQMLSDSQWKPMVLTDLAERICNGVLGSGMYAETAIRFSINRSDVAISPRQANNLALVFNELLTNSLKYAFDRACTPTVTIEIHREGEAVFIEFRDNGPGYPESVLENGKLNVGLKLVHQLVEDTLDGEITLMNSAGAVAQMRIGIEQLIPTGAEAVVGEADD